MDDGLYDAFRSKDPRFDGRFFVGVRSTGIYCRPTCRAKLPKRENCTFHSTAAAAESAGFRPCLVCRPEIAPGIVYTMDGIARKAAGIMEAECGNNISLEDVAKRTGCTSRHLRRTFMEEYGVTPVEYMQTCRSLLAKNLLTDTTLPMSAVASAAGFGSIRRFNSTFMERYNITPMSLRKRSEGCMVDGNIRLLLGYRSPYRWDEILEFLSERAIPRVETVNSGVYSRTVRIRTNANEVKGWFSVSNITERNCIGVRVSTSLLPVLSVVLSRIRNQFDLLCDPHAVYEKLRHMNHDKEICSNGTRLPGCFDPFEMSVRAVLGQQITVKAASTLAGRLAASFGHGIETDVDGLTHTFPSSWDMLELDDPIADRLGPIGITSAKANTIQRLAKALEHGAIDLSAYANVDDEMEKLIAIPGIGKWTAQYIAMRAMGWTDVFLDTDLGVRKALSPLSPADMQILSENWRPWRSYATVNLWNSLKKEGVE